MNKSIKALAISTALALTLSGCSMPSFISNLFGSEEDNMQFERAATTTASNDYEVQDTDTIVSGEVTAIVGNYVTLELGEVSTSEMATGGGDMAMGDEAQMGDGEMSADMGEMDSSEMGEMPSMDGGDFSGGDMGGSDMGGGDMDMSAMGDMSSMGGGMGGNMGGGSSATITKSGEEGSYYLPVGMPIGSGDYSTVSVGDILTLTIDKDGVVRAAEVE